MKQTARTIALVGGLALVTLGLTACSTLVSRHPVGNRAVPEPNKPVALQSASQGALGGARAQYHLRQAFVFLNMYPVNQPEVMVSNAQQRFDQEGKLTDETTKTLVQQLLTELVSWTKRLSSNAG